MPAALSVTKVGTSRTDMAFRARLRTRFGTLCGWALGRGAGGSSAERAMVLTRFGKLRKELRIRGFRSRARHKR